VASCEANGGAASFRHRADGRTSALRHAGGGGVSENNGRERESPMQKREKPTIKGDLEGKKMRTGTWPKEAKKNLGGFTKAGELPTGKGSTDRKEKNSLHNKAEEKEVPTGGEMEAGTPSKP